MKFLRGARDLAFLYLGRAASAAVGILILPLLYGALGTEAFGAAGIILSLQALVVVLDFGLSTSVGRSVSQFTRAEAPDARPHLKYAEKFLTRTYAVIGAGALCIVPFTSLPISLWGIAALVIGLACITYQNVVMAALVGRQDYAVASSIQLTGTLARHLAALLAVLSLGPSLDYFLYAHALVALGQIALLRSRFLHITKGTHPNPSNRPDLRIVWPLVLQGVAGACAMQLDKPIIAMFAGASASAPYFLASVLATVPLAMLAAPVAQYFQPKITMALAQNDRQSLARLLQYLVLGLAAVVVAPAAVMVIAMEPLTLLWLGPSDVQPFVQGYASILVLGGAIGTFGLVPNVLLIARGEFVYLSIVSVVLTLGVLSGAAMSAFVGNIHGLCFIYVAYHFAATTLLWCRAARIESELNASIISTPKLITGMVRKAIFNLRSASPKE